MRSANEPRRASVPLCCARVSWHPTAINHAAAPEAASRARKGVPLLPGITVLHSVSTQFSPSRPPINGMACCHHRPSIRSKETKASGVGSDRAFQKEQKLLVRHEGAHDPHDVCRRGVRVAPVGCPKSLLETVEIEALPAQQSQRRRPVADVKQRLLGQLGLQPLGRAPPAVYLAV